MGTWSHESFGNDTANDWAYELEDATDFSVIEAALQVALDEGDEYLDADLAMEAIAAVEVIAKRLGKGTQSDVYTEKVDQWLETISEQPSDDLLSLAKRVLERIVADDSELKELWLESDEYELWLGNIQQLKDALN
ncbi:DUF4259 domain-containing protein [Acinetobacter junii]|uniref:DUF4259 domain-containing protein n=1 Tax=Acinetobacter junii TaxID=40215 RepID=A0AAX1MI97_ACIJU|nr:DUF4259 domain-containing protein [Acinetobacter junii]APU47311.1 hypothetical protein BVL33_01570 [Acinetobacter junii]ATU43987.1 DUF4259 domain-containing protein [Acinetobacter junii]ENV65378.1 hypothetical protein F948_02980 [Acinetobacter junii CIP 64.5]MBL8281846.1 DUF4259 domain-containing protein [Acinetobacter junii]MDH0668618.1 DUF4259 domain-containing protein [Acinetobacter junii]